MAENDSDLCPRKCQDYEIEKRMLEGKIKCFQAQDHMISRTEGPEKSLAESKQ